MLKRDSFKLLFNVKREINVPKFTAVLTEDVSTNQSSVMSSLEEHPTNVTQPVEFVNVKDHLVMTKMHVLLTHMLRELDAKTLLNVCPAILV